MDIGRIGIEASEEALTHIYIQNDSLPINQDVCESPLIKETRRQLAAYFAGQLKTFSLPLAPVGTLFMRQIWNLLQEIPYGEVTTYGQIAAKAGNPGAARAVGLANNRNPLPVIIPCHRVIGANGSLTGFRGGLEMKSLLLQLEGWKQMEE